MNIFFAIIMTLSMYAVAADTVVIVKPAAPVAKKTDKSALPSEYLRYCVKTKGAEKLCVPEHLHSCRCSKE